MYVRRRCSFDAMSAVRNQNCTRCAAPQPTSRPVRSSIEIPAARAKLFLHHGHISTIRTTTAPCRSTENRRRFFESLKNRVVYDSGTFFFVNKSTEMSNPSSAYGVTEEHANLCCQLTLHANTWKAHLPFECIVGYNNDALQTVNLFDYVGTSSGSRMIPSEKFKIRFDTSKYPSTDLVGYVADMSATCDTCHTSSVMC